MPNLLHVVGLWTSCSLGHIRSLDFLLSMAMREGKSLKTYSDRYWELFNEIDGDFENVAVCTFKVGLPMNLDLRKSLIIKPA